AASFTAAKFLAPAAARSGGDRAPFPAPSAFSMRSLRHRPARRLSSVLAVSSDVLKAAPAAAAYPAVTREEALELYEDMILGRNFEDMCAQMYYRGKMFGFVHLYNGQEAVSTGFIKQLNQPDCVVSTYRDHVHALSKGVPARAVMAELFGKATGCCRGQGGSMHMFSEPHNLLGGFAFIGEGIPVATGAAFAAKYRHEVLKQSSPDGLDVTLAFFGDDPEIWKKGPAFGMPGVHVDGMDVLKVREVAKEAIDRARRGEGPTLVECETYRFRGHSLADPDELRRPDEKSHYAARDPITSLKKYIIEQNLASEAELKNIEKKIDDVVEEAVEFADASPLPPRSQLLENVFADPKGFGIGPDGKYRCEDPKFTQGTAQV
uniref:Dehydrogenase E1 component domain-containing protein n=1 Tax=Aegilops tauschii subsp. strangulata TaxID=200361 RepID=A0A453A829_AEGTS